MSSLAELKKEIGAVWCPKCREEALPHDPKGTCMFCDTLLVKDGRAIYQAPGSTRSVRNESGAAGREALERMDAGEQQRPGETRDDRDPPKPSHRKRASKWTPETIVQAIQDYVAENGRPPRRSDLSAVSATVVAQRLDWGDLMEKAGCERPRKGIPAAPLGAGSKAGATSQAPSEQPRPGPAPSGEKRSRTAKPAVPPPLSLAELAAQLEHARAEMERTRDLYYDAVDAFREHELVQTIKNEQGI